MKKILISIISVFLTLSCFAQNLERAVKVTSKDDKDNKLLRVYEVDRKKEVVGNYSSTTIEYMIENRGNRIIEGEFEFPLKDGESVSGYALDINGTMRDGVAIEKEKGRQVFEDVVRKNVDPGLVEMTAGNNFKTRVYPIPANGVRHITVTIEKEVNGKDSAEKLYTYTDGKDTYFYFYTNLQNANGKEIDISAKKITVLFDISDSAKNRDLNKEIEFLKNYSEAAGNPDIKFITFANEIIDSFEINFKKDSKSAENKIRDLKFDGSSNLSVLEKINSDSDILLFSDGLENWGKEESSKIKLSKRVVTVNSSKSANYSLLKMIANNNNGVFVNLVGTKVQQAIAKIKENPLRIISVDYDSKEFEDVYPVIGTIVDNGISVTGILKRKSGTIKVRIGHAGKIEKTIEKTISSFESDDSVESEKVPRLWAMKKIAWLESDYENNKNEIIDLAKKFTIVTKDTSLIVLDSVNDYVKYGIVPPKELKAEYDKIVSRNITTVKNSDVIPNDVYRNFEEFNKWWNKSPKDFEKKLPKKSSDASVRSNSRILYETEELQRTSVSTASTRASDAISDETVYEGRGFAEAPMMEASAVQSKMASDANSKISAESVKLQAWNSKSNYIATLKKTESSKMYAKYLELKKEYGMSPAFYMEVSDYFVEEDLVKEGKRILSNLAEINLENTDVLRALGYKLMDQKDFDYAIKVFEKLVKLRSEVPQFRRDLAMAYEQNGNYQEAVDSLWYVASHQWDSRYNEIQQTCLNDMNSIIDRNKKIDTSAIDKKLQKNFDVDLRIVLTWNTDDCDIDLWVTDPKNEKCYYGNKLTSLGGRMSRDFTQGYGPEEFCIKVAPNGEYKIQCNYYGSHKQKALQPVVVQAEVYTNFGRPNQSKQIMTLQLDDVKQSFTIGNIKIK